jgi:hypothetical protein
MRLNKAFPIAEAVDQTGAFFDTIGKPISASRFRRPNRQIGE